MKIAVTGKIGSGKSMVMKTLKSLGAYTVIADEINKRLLVDKAYLSMLKKHFPECFNLDVFDKKMLSRIVFSDPQKRKLLDEIAHPEIYRIIKEHTTGKDLAFVEVPILTKERAKEFDLVVLVKSQDDERKRRVKKRDNRSDEEIEGIFLAQKDIDEKSYQNVLVIENDTSEQELAKKVKLLYEKLV